MPASIAPAGDRAPSAAVISLQPRLREARNELRALMEDQQQALMDAGRSESQAVGAVIAEFGSLEEVAGELGISAELGGGAGAGAVPALAARRPCCAAPARAWPRDGRSRFVRA